MRGHKPPRRAILTALYTTVVFCILSVTMFFAGLLVYILYRIKLIHSNAFHVGVIPGLVLVFVSIILGTFIAALTSHIPLQPINKLIHGMKKLAQGDFSARIDLGNMGIAKEVNNSFNTLAKELENTRILQTDFVNNFSHEFKTPIVSIRGFAKLLQKGNLSKEREQEYLAIIVDESSRLADLATNVLNLTRVENQNILTDVMAFNLSEQVRNSILVLERKWNHKNITMVAEFSEHTIEGNEELLKQIWINLLDNSIKFSPENREVICTMKEAQGILTVSMVNYGPQIAHDEVGRIFDKFWQGDRSHAMEGTGIGLSIAKRIAELHKGSISVKSTESETVFEVHLPIKQKLLDG